MIGLHLPMLRALCLMHLIELIEGGQLSVPEVTARTGLSAEDLQKLRSMPVTELLQLANQERPEMMLSFVEGMPLALSQLNRTRNEREMLEYFLSNGAPTSMLRKLFTVGHDTISHLRQYFPTTSGRPKLPHPDVRDAIHKRWNELKTLTSERERYRALHESFNGEFALGVLYHVVTEFGMEVTV